LRAKILDFYPKKGIYSALKYSKIDALHHIIATPSLLLLKKRIMPLPAGFSIHSKTSEPF
jgi:hypothetical protein